MVSQAKLAVKVSVITVVYNAVHTIEETIRSVINQTYQNIEYIVIDGGSTDGTLDVIKKYLPANSYFKSEPDTGIADAFNKGVAVATGDWVAIINADDWYVSNAVESMMKAVNDTTDVCCGNIMLVGENDYRRVKPSKVNWLNYGMYIMHPTCFIRREVYASVGDYDTSLSIAMDYDMLMRIRNSGFKIQYIDELVTYMRTGGASSDITRMHQEEIKVIKNHLNGYSYWLSRAVKYADIIRWRFFYKSPFKVVA
ncbi:glycosyltransferase family 2 protein [Mucilaginibacter glaciei]|uniref:Glycosyltransferase n=1 Tax=Mucilaginibacter glaciei TaxID=2772109 RepID=A0A926NUT9_9SPHI|nr:glycosyltransferase family 2 protein [Mucilaginibacter glaciei]MBD1395402.1 glycosyltransferase [Mucilaginibacter glaciei]